VEFLDLVDGTVGLFNRIFAEQMRFIIHMARTSPLGRLGAHGHEQQSEEGGEQAGPVE